MSRVGLKGIAVPSGVSVSFKESILYVKGPKGEIHRALPAQISVNIGGGEVTLSRVDDTPMSKSLHGLTRSEIYNMVVGVTQKHEKVLEVTGVGYRAALQGRALSLSLGYSHPIQYSLPDGIEATVDKQVAITLKGVDKRQVGQVAADIRAFRVPEPYKGKGVKYQNEQIVRKEGKSGKQK